ncbi:MAG: hypothetical protein Q4G51_13535 [Dermatophilus congolensis]|nr:hypothetical protein [Dermatophilus congolensis]
MSRLGKTKLTLEPWALVVFFVLFGLAAAVVPGYTDPAMRLGAIEDVLPGFYSHASNLTLSYALIIVYGIVRLLAGAGLREIALFTAAVLAANDIYEGGLTLWNTKDLVDAHYGAVGSLVAFGYLVLVKRHGLRRAPAASGAGERQG